MARRTGEPVGLMDVDVAGQDEEGSNEDEDDNVDLFGSDEEEEVYYL